MSDAAARRETSLMGIILHILRQRCFSDFGDRGLGPSNNALAQSLARMLMVASVMV